MIQVYYIYCVLYFYYYYIVHCDYTVMQAMGNSRKHRWSSPCLPAAHLLLCGLVPNRPQTGTSPWHGVGDPCQVFWLTLQNSLHKTSRVSPILAFFLFNEIRALLLFEDQFLTSVLNTSFFHCISNLHTKLSIPSFASLFFSFSTCTFPSTWEHA